MHTEVTRTHIRTDRGFTHTHKHRGNTHIHTHRGYAHTHTHTHTHTAVDKRVKVTEWTVCFFFFSRHDAYDVIYMMSCIWCVSSAVQVSVRSSVCTVTTPAHRRLTWPVTWGLILVSGPLWTQHSLLSYRCYRWCSRVVLLLDEASPIDPEMFPDSNIDYWRLTVRAVTHPVSLQSEHKETSL